MTLPHALRRPVEAAIELIGAGERMASTRPVSGGCIHHGLRVETDAGAALFLKWSERAGAGMFEAEADGLLALRRAATARVPEPLAWDDGDSGGPSWLLMEYVEPGPAGAGGGRALGEALAGLHRAGSGGDGRGESGEHGDGAPGDGTRHDDGGPAGGPDSDRRFGWHLDNWIGTLPQANPSLGDWGAFWRDHRLLPQLEQVRAQGRLDDAVLDRAAELAGESLDHVRSPELLHGDLWSGNTFHATDGAPVLIDPAVYYGDGEVDLAMSELFGGFSDPFYAAYDAARPISPEYGAFARDLYQLYYLLVHVNLFGASYEAGALAAARRAVAALG